MDLNEISLFIKVAQLGSYTKAAEALKIPKSTISTKIANLEKRLRVSLIHRTTRKINLTPMGQKFYDRCVINLENLKSAEEELVSDQKSPSGKLTITAPTFLGSFLLPEILKDYSSKFPDVHIELILTDRHVDLIDQGVDLAIRAGKLEDSTLLGRKISDTYFGLFCSQEYYKQNKLSTLRHPKDLKDYKCLQFTALGRKKWTLSHLQEKISVSVPLDESFICDDLFLLKEMTTSGCGVSLLPIFMCHDDVKNKNIVHLLPQWQTEKRPLTFIYPNSKFILPKLKFFMEIAEKNIQKKLLGD